MKKTLFGIGSALALVFFNGESPVQAANTDSFQTPVTSLPAQKRELVAQSFLSPERRRISVLDPGTNAKCAYLIQSGGSNTTMFFDCVIKAGAEDGLINKLEITPNMWDITPRPTAFFLNNYKEEITDALSVIYSDFTSSFDGVYEISGNEIALAFEDNYYRRIVFIISPDEIDPTVFDSF